MTIAMIVAWARMNVSAKLAAMGLVCMAPCACDEPAAYWAAVCEDIAAGEGLPSSGIIRVERVVVADVGGHAVMWPDAARYPQCRVPVTLEFSDDVELNEMDTLRAAGGALPPVSINGRGEWTPVGLAITSIAVHGAMEISD